MQKHQDLALGEWQHLAGAPSKTRTNSYGLPLNIPFAPKLAKVSIQQQVGEARHCMHWNWHP